MNILLHVVFLFFFFVALLAPANAENFHFQAAGREEVVFRHPQIDCRTNRIRDHFDLPATAFRRTGGQIIMIAGNRLNQVFRGRTFETLRRRNCESLNVSDSNPNPSAFRDQEWVTALFSFDGKNVTAYVHNEHHGEIRGEKCKIVLSHNRECWYASTTMLRSSNGAKSFVAGAPESDLLIGPAIPYKTGRKRIGTYLPKVVGSPDSKWVYVFVSRSDSNTATRIGQCLLRSDRSQRNWRLWGPDGFQPFVNSPYFGDTKSRMAEHCTPVIRGNIQSIKYIPEIEQFVAIGGSRRQGVFASFSKDLVKWSKKRKIEGIAIDQIDDISNLNRGEFPKRRWYFSLLDPKSKSRNFDTVSRTPYLYFVKFGEKNNRKSSVRTLMRIPLVLTGG